MEDNRKENREVSVHCLKSMKDYIKHLALGMDGQRGYYDSDSDTDDEDDWIAPCVESVRSYWNSFTAAWQREYPTNPISNDVQKSVTQVCVPEIHNALNRVD